MSHMAKMLRFRERRGSAYQHNAVSRLEVWAMLEKKALWKMAVDLLEAELGPALFHMLRDGCYLDSLEEGTAIVAAETEYLRDFYRKKAAKPLEKAFSQLLKRSITVKIAIGHPR